jgi:hypothetical protein
MRVWLGICSAALFVMSSADASAFSMSFRWCGRGSPVFSLSGVPKSTAALQFHMVDFKSRATTTVEGQYRTRGNQRCLVVL